jgi:inosose dehydratase
MNTTPGHETVLLELDAAADPIAALKSGKSVVERVAS